MIELKSGIRLGVSGRLCTPGKYRFPRDFAHLSIGQNRGLTGQQHHGQHHKLAVEVAR